jgi:hypothetical protein
VLWITRSNAGFTLLHECTNACHALDGFIKALMPRTLPTGFEKWVKLIVFILKEQRNFIEWF